MDLGYRRRPRVSDSRATLKIGLGAVLTLTILCLLLYCSPGSKYEVQTEGAADAELLEPDQALETTSSLLEVITDSNLVAASTDKKHDAGRDESEVQDEQSIQEAYINYAGDLTDQAFSFPSSHQSIEQDPAAALRSKVEKLQAGKCLGGICKNGTLAPSDFVFAVATHSLNEPTLVAGRAARQRFRTYVSTNYTEVDGRRYPKADSETWGYYPDDVRLRSFYEGDTRAALVPFLAYRDLGPTFKWLFYGDDDTILFIDPAMNLVKDLDPEMPYFLTDHFWYSNWNYGYQWHPHWRAPRCLLCNSPLDVNSLRMKMVKACPCTPKAICDLDGGYDNVLDSRKCGVPRSPTMTYSMHGGAGALISVGLLKQVSFEAMEDCVLNEWSTGGDALITICLWKAGYAMTDPGPLWHEDGLTHFDPSPRKLILDQVPVVVPRASYLLGNFLAKAAGVCGNICQSELQNVVSMHLRSRLLTNSSEGAGVLLRGVTRFVSQFQGLELDNSKPESLQDVHDSRYHSFAREVDDLFSEAVNKLKNLTPNFRAIAKTRTRWPIDGGASVFVTKSRLKEAVNGTVVLSYEEIVKGGSAGVARDLLEGTLSKTLQVFPPIVRRRLLP